MIPYPKIDPVIVKIGPLAVRWYGMMYFFGFVASYLLVRYQVKKKRIPMSGQEIDSLYTYIILGLLIGARLGYVLFYNLSSYLANPLDVLEVWHGGMSFHGGLIGVVVSGILFCRKYKRDFWQVADLVVVTAPIGLGLGRLGNFINGELYGRVTDVPWAMVFPSGGPLPRHPSELYEFLLEGVVLFAVLWRLKDRAFVTGTMTALFIILYGVFRIFVEFFREPDPQLGFILGPFTMGQLLSGVMVLFGAGLFYYRNRKAQKMR